MGEMADKIMKFILLTAAIAGLCSAADECSEAKIQDSTTLAVCLTKLKDAFSADSTMSGKVKPAGWTKFDLFLKVEVESDKRKSTSICCQTWDFPEKKYEVDPTSASAMMKGPVPVNTVLNGEHEAEVQNSTAIDTSKYYSMVMVDLCTAGTPSTFCATAKPFVNWFVANVKGSEEMKFEKDMEGNTTEEFFGLVKPSFNSFYMYLLYEHVAMISNTSLSTYAPSGASVGCAAADSVGRCQFDIIKYAADKEMKLVGANWYSVDKDAEWARVQIAGGYMNETTACKDAKVFPKVCDSNECDQPTDGKIKCKQTTTGSASIYLSLTLFLAVLLRPLL